MRLMLVTGFILLVALAGCDHSKEAEKEAIAGTEIARPATRAEADAPPVPSSGPPVDTPPAAVAASSATATSTYKSGEKVYNAACAACHGTGLLNAPVVGDHATWAPRLGQGREGLYKHALEGFNQMPAKGGNAGLTDDEVKQAVDFMVKKSG